AVGRKRPRAADAGVGLAARAEEASVELDRDWMRQALDDVLDNALRVTPGGGHIEIAGAVMGGHVRITIEDSGPGFDDAFIARAFDPFAQDRSEDEAPAGAGLGLAIVRAIAQAHDGSAFLENTG